MAAGMGRTGSNNDKGIIAAPPASIRVTIVSPMALDIPKITAVQIPDKAPGIDTYIMVSQEVAPKAREASFKSRGTAYRASSAILQMVGRLINASTTDAVNKLIPTAMSKVSCNQGAITIKPKKPSTTEGKAAGNSTMGLTIARVLADAISDR
jgi:hypothetical protein